jgi:hypothetical protein
MHEVDHIVLGIGGSTAAPRFFDTSKAQAFYASYFEVGDRGGAMIDFGNAIVLECYVPYLHEVTGDNLPFMPLPLTGRDIIHDIGRKRAVTRREREACERGVCRCTSRPTGWRLTRPILRAMLGVTDSWINDHGRQLPGLISGSWELTYDTPTFMAECYFNPEFIVLSRAASRAARSARQRSRSAR